MKATTSNGRTSKLWLALGCGMACSAVLMLTNHSQAEMQAAPAAQNVQTVVITAKRMSAAEKAQSRVEPEQAGNHRA